MGDRVDDLMTMIWPKLEEEVTAGLDLKPPLKDYLPVDKLAKSEPYRLMESPDWEDCQSIPTSGSSLRRFRTNDAFEGAYELAVRFRVSMYTLEDDQRALPQRGKQFAERARLAERQAALTLLGDDNPVGAYNKDVIVAAAADRYPEGPVRLVVRHTGETSEAVKKSGVVDTVVDAHGLLPKGVMAILLTLNNGPTVRRVVDDFTATWMRSPGGGVTLTLSERFFLDHPTRAVRFIASG